MDSFPLSWRFTDPKYNLLPPEDLNRIHPLNTIKRISLYNNALRYVNNFEFNKDEVKEIEYINLENGLTVSQIANWISDRITSNLLIIWNKETAVHTEKDVFVKYFDDFLYPSSDDVIIIPQNSNWIMYYMHANILYYGRIKNK